MTNRSGTTAEVAPGPLLDWFDTDGRDLPWRRTRDPWAVLVSELMLQQTRVARIVDRWPQFLARFPTPTACADAGPAAVIAEWKGLGYNRRALNLHRAAVAIRDEHCGEVPRDLDALLALPGIGPYTARAVSAFAFEFDVGVVDTNIGRVLARLGAVSLKPAQAQRFADHLVPDGRGWEWNQALMELGALVCRPLPQCPMCPLASDCRWHAAGRPLPDPSSGSAAVSKSQSRFEGSDRQGRGRLVDRLRSGAIDLIDAAAVMGWDGDAERADRVVTGLVSDGMVERVGDRLQLVSS